MDGVVLVGGDTGVEVKGIGESAAIFGPLQRRGRRADSQEILKEQGFDLRGGVEAIGVEMDEGAGRTAVDGIDVERRAGDVLGDAEAPARRLDERGFADAEVPSRASVHCAGRAVANSAAIAGRPRRRRW